MAVTTAASAVTRNQVGWYGIDGYRVPTVSGSLSPDPIPRRFPSLGKAAHTLSYPLGDSTHGDHHALATAGNRKSPTVYVLLRRKLWHEELGQSW